MWSKVAAVGNAWRCPRSQPVRRRRIVHMSMACRARSARPPRPRCFWRPPKASTGTALDLPRLPRTISFTRSLRQALTRRCSVRSCAFAAYASGTIAASRSINTLACSDGSAINQPSMTGHASANGSGRFLHQCLALGCLRCVGRASPSFHARDRLARNTETSDAPSSSLRRAPHELPGRSASAEPTESPAATAQGPDV